MSKVDPDESGGSSICCDQTRAPIAYHWFARSPQERPIDVFRGLLEETELTRVQRIEFTGQFRATMHQLQRGRLMPLHELKGPMRAEKRLALFELRLSFDYGREVGEVLEAHVRFYHVEPRGLSSGPRPTVIGLHAHNKDARAEDASDQQTEQIRIASDRYFEGRLNRWGLSG